MTRTAFVVGASRGLGLGVAAALAQRGWQVTGTVRGTDRTALHELADTSDGRVGTEHVDITVPVELAALRDRIAGVELDLLLVNAGATGADLPVGQVSAEDFTHVMVTNALGPMWVVESLAPLVRTGGTIAVMSSRQGSISLNTRGGHEVYRASKSALNQLMRSYAVRRPDDHTLMLIHPGWVQTDLGGPEAPLSVAESVSGVVEVIEQHAGETGLQFLDHTGAVVPW